MSKVLEQLKENSTYNVSIHAINQYGDGQPANLQFCTAAGKCLYTECLKK